MARGGRRYPWFPDETDAFIKIVSRIATIGKKFSAKDWHEVAAELDDKGFTRTPAACRTRALIYREDIQRTFWHDEAIRKALNLPWVGPAVSGPYAEPTMGGISTIHDEVTILVDALSEGIRKQIDAMIIDNVLEKGVDNTE